MEILNASLPDGFGQNMTEDQRGLSFWIVNGFGVDAAELEQEVERIMAEAPGTDGQVAVFRAARNLIE